MDAQMLAKCICVSHTCIDNWVAQGILPAPRKRGGKLMWKWAEVDERLTLGTECTGPESQAERIRDGTRAAATEVRPRYR
jgi:hypothetical protein